MIRLADRTVSLSALSAHQQALVERHLPLVHCMLRRMEAGGLGAAARQQRADLVQEGCIALTEALRNHDPLRHGPFAAYALSRIHFAISRYIHERTSVIRVPFITHRRHKAARAQEATGDDGPVGVVVDGDLTTDLPDQRVRPSPANPDDGGEDESLRARYDAALKRTIRGLKQSPRCSARTRAILDRCGDERWSIPDPDHRTSLRVMADEANCSLGRVAHWDRRIRSRMAEEMRGDRGAGRGVKGAPERRRKSADPE